MFVSGETKGLNWDSLIRVGSCNAVCLNDFYLRVNLNLQPSLKASKSGLIHILPFKIRGHAICLIINPPFKKINIILNLLLVF